MSEECICDQEKVKRVLCSSCRKGFSWTIPKELMKYYCDLCKKTSFLCGSKEPLCPDCIAQGWKKNSAYGGPTILTNPVGKSGYIKPFPCKICNGILDDRPDRISFLNCRCAAYSGLHYRCIDPRLEKNSYYKNMLKQDPQTLLDNIEKHGFVAKVMPKDDFFTVHIKIWCEWCKE